MGNDYYKKLAQAKAKKQSAKDRLTRAFGEIPNKSGIYVFYREEDGFKYAYVGQAKYLLGRLAEHLLGYQHIDLSIRKHGLYKDNENETGYRVWWQEFEESDLNEKERYYIRYMASLGYQLRNKTLGGQDTGKNGLDTQQEPKGYHDGLKQGYKNAQKYIAKLFEKNLEVVIKGKDGALKQRALEKFNDFLDYEEVKLEENE